MPRVYNLGVLDWESNSSSRIRAGRVRLSEFSSSSFAERMEVEISSDEIMDDLNRCTYLYWALTLDFPLKRSSPVWAFAALSDDGTIHTTVEPLGEDEVYIDWKLTQPGEAAFLTGIPANLLTALIWLMKQKSWEQINLSVSPEEADRVSMEVCLKLTEIRFPTKYLESVTRKINGYLRDTR